ncbi:unnamed protein product [Rotaria sordida]|uniref:Uncharacterized protein n=1 Tax=Rotaria sordida TaxID=392033 RepID=A0A819EX92_9BILA|nr:unnamed protein product [Rotaria sordida]CAF3859102.1 unnamed protein product [Rotaria sordida]
MGIFEDDAFLRMHLAVILLVTSVDVLLIWQGDELGDASSFDELDENKTTNHYDMHWDYLNQERNRQLFNTFKQLFDLRRMNTSLRHGTIEFFHEDSDNYVLTFDRNKDVFIICHFSSKTVSNCTVRNIPTNGNWIDYLTKE